MNITKTNHEIDYLIRGEEMQCVEIELDPTETAIAEAGSFMMIDEGIQMQTIFGDGTGREKGFLGKLWSAGKRVLTGESLFMTAFTNEGQGKKKVTFALGGIKNTLFGGEGLFFATLRGPGKVWIQSLPISRLASRILAYGTYKRKEEGSILGGIGNILDGDGS